MHLHSRALMHFDTIRRCGSIREAARQLHVSSSALNRQLLELEGEVGTPLFERLRTGLKLTPAGEVLSRHVLNVMQDAQRMAAELDAVKGLRRGVIEVVTVESVIADFLPRVLLAMTERYPRVQMRVRICGSVDAANAVSKGLADVALCFIRQRMQDLRQVAAGKFSLGAVVAANHALASSSEVTIEECARHPLILPTPDIAIRDELNLLLMPHQGQLQIAIESGSLELIRRLATQGVGVAFSNPFGIEKEVAGGQLRYMPIKGASAFVLGQYVRANRTLPPALAAFSQLAADEIARRELQHG
ncbi:LysR family transcriptional regulator [soil metagenome]